mgnify:CR=1 FL=1
MNFTHNLPKLIDLQNPSLIFVISKINLPIDVLFEGPFYRDTAFFIAVLRSQLLSDKRASSAIHLSLSLI